MSLVASVDYMSTVEVDRMVVSLGMVNVVRTSFVQFNVPQVFRFPFVETSSVSPYSCFYK